MTKIAFTAMATLICAWPHFVESASFFYKTDPYATHQPILYEIVINTEGPIIEFGCGDGSTGLLHEICKKSGRELISIDDNLEWLNKYKNRYLNDGYNQDNTGWHKFYFVPGKYNDLDAKHWVTFFEQAPFLKDKKYSVCFIDQSPWMARYITLQLFKDKTEYIIVHDCDYFPHTGIFGKELRDIDRKNSIPGIYDFSDVIKYFKVYFPPLPWAGETGPPTLVGSQYVQDLPDIDYSQY